ncbi:MAG: hypothetical protein KC457_27465 [Myxococcales bacterium]|nr:hypothetical protein [Myxococcales bacterium]
MTITNIQPTFESTHPIDFDLEHDGAEQAVLLTGEPVTLTLILRNTGVRDIDLVLDDDSEAPHLRLSFGPGFLGAEALAAVTVLSADWALQPEPIVDDVAVVQLRSSRARSLAPGAELRIELGSIAINRVGGGRMVAARLYYDRLRFAGDDVPLTGFRSLALRLVNTTGTRRPAFAASLSPLRPEADVVRQDGPTSLLNVAADPDSLALQLICLADDPLAFVAGETSIEVVLPLGGAADPRALVDSDEAAAGISYSMWRVSADGSSAARSTDPHYDSGTVSWTAAAGEGLGVGESLLLVLDGVDQRRCPQGFATLRVRWIDVPTFADGETAVVVPRSPMRIVGTRLDMRGDAVVSGQLGAGSLTVTDSITAKYVQVNEDLTVTDRITAKYVQVSEDLTVTDLVTAKRLQLGESILYTRSWQTPNLTNGASAQGAYYAAQYCKDPLGVVHMRGYVHDIPAGTWLPLFQLAPGHRPARCLKFSVPGDNVVYIDRDGYVRVSSPGQAYLAGVSFFAEK